MPLLRLDNAGSSFLSIVPQVYHLSRAYSCGSRTTSRISPWRCAAITTARTKPYDHCGPRVARVSAPARSFSRLWTLSLVPSVVVWFGRNAVRRLPLWPPLGFVLVPVLYEITFSRIVD